MEKKLKKSELLKKGLINIDFAKVSKDSENVYSYFANHVINDLKHIDWLFETRFTVYAEKHNINIKEVFRLFEIGEEVGRSIVKKNIRKRKLISTEGGKYYLFEVGKTYNLGAKYYHSGNKVYFIEHYQTDHDPNIIIKMGEIIGEYWCSWIEILKNHMVFEPLFKNEMENIEKDSLFNIVRFPCKNVNGKGFPDSMKIFKDFWYSINKTNKILKAKSEELLNDNMNDDTMHLFFRYDLLPDYQFVQFINETTNNFDSGVYEKHKEEYDTLLNDLNDCISTFKSLTPIFTKDMSHFFKFQAYRENWFKYVYDQLVNTKQYFLEITDKEGNSNYFGFDCTLEEEVVREIHQIMTDKEYIQADINDFLKVFHKKHVGRLEKPVRWNIKPGKPTKTALFSFIKLMLNTDTFPREALRKANYLFTPEDIFPEKYTYPSSKEGKDEIGNTISYYFNEVKDLVNKTRPLQ